MPDKYEMRDRQSFGVILTDIYKNGDLFVSEVSQEAAEAFCADPDACPADAPAVKLRAWLIEQWHQSLQEEQSPMDSLLISFRAADAEGKELLVRELAEQLLAADAENVQLQIQLDRRRESE